MYKEGKESRKHKKQKVKGPNTQAIQHRLNDIKVKDIKIPT
jgi:hypothetical protein